MVDRAEEEILEIDLSLCTKRFVIIVEKIAKYLLSQQAVNLYFAAVVLKKIEVPIQEDLREEILKDLLILRISECLTQFVIIVEIVVRFLFSQAVESQSTAVIVLELKRKVEAKIENNFNLGLNIRQACCPTIKTSLSN